MAMRRAMRETGERQIELEGEAVAYRLIRSRRRSIGIEIASGGALVRAPHWARVGDIHAFMLDNSKWIRTKLHTWRTARAAVRPEDWRDGGTVRYQGQDLRLSVFGSRKRTAFHDLFDLRIGIPKPSAERICEAVEEWLKARAEETFLPRVEMYCERLDLRVPTVKLSNSRTQWGSCEQHRAGRSLIRLQWRLVQLAPDLADYIIAHEVCHLREMNHSPKFWATVLSVYPLHREAERSLRHLAPLIEP